VRELLFERLLHLEVPSDTAALYAPTACSPQ